MAQEPKTGVSFCINQNTTSTTTTILANQPNGITVTSVKVENDAGGYLSPNSSGRTFRLIIKGSISGSKELWSYTAGATGGAFPYADFSGGNTLLKGDIQIVFSASSSIDWGPQGYVNSGKFKVTLFYEPYWTNCNAPASVSLSRTRNQITISWSGASGGTNNAINKYSVYLSTSSGGGVAYVGSTALHTYVTSTATSGSYTFTVNTSTTYYGAVCTMAPHNNSSYTWSGAVIVPAKPSVSAGTSVTKAQMDALKTWINGSQTTVTQYATITAIQGNTYRNVLTAGTTVIDDAWYNAAATG